MYKCHHYRSISGIIALKKKYRSETVNRACERACYFDNITYRAVKNICENGMDRLPMDNRMCAGDEQISTYSNIRDLGQYRQMLALGVIDNE